MTRQDVEQALIALDMENWTGEETKEYFKELLSQGFKGYHAFNVDELEDTYNTRTLRDGGDMVDIED